MSATAGVAQSVERVALTQEHLKVAGSSPAFGSISFAIFFGFFLGRRRWLVLKTKQFQESYEYLNIVCPLRILQYPWDQ